MHKPGEKTYRIENGGLIVDGDPLFYKSAEFGVDGDHAFVLLGPNLQEGEAEFVKIDQEDSAGAAMAACRLAHARLCERLGLDSLPWHLGKSHPYYCG